MAAQLDVNGGLMTYANNSDTMGTFTLRYGDAGTLNVVNPPTNYQFLRVDVESLGQSGAVGDSFALNVSAIDTSGASASQTTTVDAAAGEYFFAYSSFAGVDFTSLDALTFEFVSQNLGATLTLDEITREIVPEPTTAGLIGVAAMGLLARRRRA